MKGLRRPVPAEVFGHSVELLTVGHLAEALDRTRWTIDHWTRLGIFPLPPFVQHPDRIAHKRRFYPASFAAEVERIAQETGLGPTLRRSDWLTYRNFFETAYLKTVATLIPDGVTPPVEVVVSWTAEGRFVMVPAYPSTA